MNIAIPFDKHILIVYAVFFACAFNLMFCMLMNQFGPRWMWCDLDRGQRGLNPIYWIMAICLGGCYVWTGLHFW